LIAEYDYIGIPEAGQDKFGNTPQALKKLRRRTTDAIKQFLRAAIRAARISRQEPQGRKLRLSRRSLCADPIGETPIRPYGYRAGLAICPRYAPSALNSAFDPPTVTYGILHQAGRMRGERHATFLTYLRKSPAPIGPDKFPAANRPPRA
jgi:hypothetical protein